jgi:hypothetical protein
VAAAAQSFLLKVLTGVPAYSDVQVVKTTATGIFKKGGNEKL